jgi:hypothetical protein
MLINILYKKNDAENWFYIHESAWIHNCHKTCSWTSSTQYLHLHVYKLIKRFNGMLKELEMGNKLVDMGVWVSWKCCASFSLLGNCKDWTHLQ